MDAHSSEQTLISSAQQGDLESFNQLVLGYQDLAYRHAHALTQDSDAAEDITQESFIRAFQSLRDFRGGSWRAWLLKIVTNAAYDRARKMKRHPMVPLFPEDDDGAEVESPVWLADPAASVEATVQQNETMEQLQQLLNELPEVFRNVIVLIDLYELDYTEAAEVLNIPLGTLKSRLARARLQMQSKIRRQDAYLPIPLASSPC